MIQVYAVGMIRLLMRVAAWLACMYVDGGKSELQKELPHADESIKATKVKHSAVGLHVCSKMWFETTADSGLLKRNEPRPWRTL